MKYRRSSFMSGLAAIFIATGLSAPIAALSHHAFSAEFDRDLPITVTGAVTKVEWTNPHARIYVDAEDENGNVVNWDFELGSPNNLMRRGWTRNSLKIGTMVTIAGHRTRNHPHVGNASSIKLTDGTQLFAGSSAEEEQ